MLLLGCEGLALAASYDGTCPRHSFCLNVNQLMLLHLLLQGKGVRSTS